MSQGIPAETIDEINEAIFVGQKLKAIKVYREATGEGLKEAKEFIDALAKRLQEKSPDKFKVDPSSGGCMSVLLFVISLGFGGGATWWLCG